MAKKSKKSSDTVVLNNEDYECFKRITNKLNKTIIVKVGAGEGEMKDQLARVKKSNRDLKRKVALSIKEKVELQSDNAKLKSVVSKDDTGIILSFKKMEDEIRNLRLENSGYSELDEDRSRLESEVKVLEEDISKFKKEVKVRDNSIGELTAKNEELQKELDIRIQEDNRFNILDL